MHRRGPGAKSHLLKQQQIQQKLQDKGNEISSLKIDQARQICEDFKSQLSQFCQDHRERINRDSKFREKFFDMCLAVGVDPLAAAARRPKAVNIDTSAIATNNSKNKTNSIKGGPLSNLFPFGRAKNANSPKNIVNDSETVTSLATKSDSKSSIDSTNASEEMVSFYSDLAVQILTVCMRTRPLNGGLLDSKEALAKLNHSAVVAAANATNSRNREEISANFYTESDLTQAIRLLEKGFNKAQITNDSNTNSNSGNRNESNSTQKVVQNTSGISIKPLKNGARVICSVPEELDDDHTIVLGFAAGGSQSLPQYYRGSVTLTELEDPIRGLGWTRVRAWKALHFLIREGLVWVEEEWKSGGDKESEDKNGGARYWFPSVALQNGD